VALNQQAINTFFYGNGNKIHELGTIRVEFVSDRMQYITLRGSWSGMIVLNVHASAEGETDDMKDSYEELEHIFNRFRE
jgi:hypothetical protein